MKRIDSKKKMQALFFKAVNGLAKQGFEQSKDGLDMECRLRGDDNRACFVGQLISDSQFKKIGENVGDAIDLISKFPTVRRFLFEGQIVHDVSSRPSYMRKRLRELASKHGLEIPKCLEENE